MNTKFQHVLSLLEKIRLASGALLQKINQSFLHNTTLDHHSKCWLSGKEPKACLEILQQMVNLASDSVNAPALSIKDQINNVIELFDK